MTADVENVTLLRRSYLSESGGTDDEALAPSTVGSTGSTRRTNGENHRRRSRNNNNNGGGPENLTPLASPANSPPLSRRLRKFSKLSSVSSLDNVDQETLLSDYFSSDELDKLSNCLSEASSESPANMRRSLVYEIFQAQLALWTFIGSVLYSYAWSQHRKKFLLTSPLTIPLLTSACCAVSALLTALVVLSRLLATPFAYDDLLRRPNAANQQSIEASSSSLTSNLNGSTAATRLVPIAVPISGSSSSVNVCCNSNGGELILTPLARQRSYSGVSRSSSSATVIAAAASATTGAANFTGSTGAIGLPRPLCRRHSSSQGSVNSLFGCSLGAGAVSTTTLTTSRPPSSLGGGGGSCASSVVGGPTTGRKLSYYFRHCASSDDPIAMGSVSLPAQIQQNARSASPPTSSASGPASPVHAR